MGRWSSDHQIRPRDITRGGLAKNTTAMPWEETRLPHEHDRIANSYCPRNANGPPNADVIVMVLCSGTENPQITPEIGLTVRRHDAAQRWPHLHNLDALTHFEAPLKPAILQKTLISRCGFDDNVRAKATRIELCICADQRAQVGERATRQDVHAR